ncbi:NSUN2, partial [Symbiodinium pilosum]
QTALMSMCLASAALAQVYQDCTVDETAGIAQCESPGEGFLFDQNKAARCPARGAEGIWNFTGWSCDDWKCHMYCSNPSRPAERKSCTNCPEVE